MWVTDYPNNLGIASNRYYRSRMVLFNLFAIFGLKAMLRLYIVESQDKMFLNVTKSQKNL